MKYNEDAFNISAQYYSDIQEVETDDNDRKVLNKLLQILLKRFSKELEENKTQNNGIIKIRFKRAFYQNPDEGYNLIKELVKSKKFDSLASQYCFYLGNIEDRYDEYCTSYFEIIWDYKTYFESLSMSQKDIKAEDTNLSKNPFVESLIEFKQLPLKYQIAVLDSCSSKISEYKEAFFHEESGEKEPQELTDEREEKNKQARIKRLERELKILKGES